MHIAAVYIEIALLANQNEYPSKWRVNAFMATEPKLCIQSVVSNAMLNSK